MAVVARMVQRFLCQDASLVNVAIQPQRRNKSHSMLSTCVFSVPDLFIVLFTVGVFCYILSFADSCEIVHKFIVSE